ncbi:MAG: hypothetical protein R2772_02230 [Chitinophagales bacterium]
MKKFNIHLLVSLAFSAFTLLAFANTEEEHLGGEEVETVYHSEVEEVEHEFDAKEVIMHHIGDANEFHIAGDLSLPLPIILWEKGVGLEDFHVFFFSSWCKCH